MKPVVIPLEAGDGADRAQLLAAARIVETVAYGLARERSVQKVVALLSIARDLEEAAAELGPAQKR